MAWSRALLTAYCLFFISVVSAFDTSAEYVLVFLTEKKSIQPEEMEHLFAPLSVERRARQNLKPDIHDYPVNEEFVNKLFSAGLNVIDHSRWLNAVLISIPKKDKKSIKKLLQFDFIERIEFLGGKGRLEEFTKTDTLQEKTEVNILHAASLKAVGLDTLHRLGYQGKGVNIAILDAGYIGVDIFDSFSHLRLHNQIKKVKNFTSADSNIFNESIHGTKVLSLLSGKNGDNIIGAAPDANFWLLKTENINYEHPVEEFFYVKALEYCDSIGIDIVNASIGYYSFDDNQYDYQNSDVYMRKSISTRASELAAGRGMMVVTSAGNEGALPWKDVTFPADAENILAVGVTNLQGRPTAYASYGRDNVEIVRPNISAPGHKVYTIDEKGVYSLSFGSSYAAPLITGAVACLWEKYPNLTVVEIISLLEHSAAHYPQSSLQTGYGTPDLKKVVRELDLTNK